MNTQPDRTHKQSDPMAAYRGKRPPAFLGILAAITAFGLGAGVVIFLKDISYLIVLSGLTMTIIALARVARRNKPSPLSITGIYWSSWFILASLILLIAWRIIT
ncbi:MULTISPECIES: hypothetical protein [Hyphomonas]|jgi:hypothetical protein|uniref:Uncharacterized protein n=1 Tax=Hyphomonas adhaerens TaxID=81029 RepID=A0A3B9GUE5_9PROT|nr:MULTISPECIES: hypothetical protein [Hyphomonas]HAE26071.1 hypothetical protein [Hyphomonas adhaerens]